MLTHNGWLQKEVYEALGVRAPTMIAALNLFAAFGGKNIVETGTYRTIDNWSEGRSTYLWSKYARFQAREQVNIYTVDIDPQVLEKARQELGEKDISKVTYISADSVEFLRKFDQSIDLLYLDSLDCNQPQAAQTHQKKELIAALPKLSTKCVILLDDNGWDNGGKTMQSKTVLVDLGFKLVLDAFQSLWIRYD